MSQNLRTRLLVILAVVGAAVYFSFPIQKRINLGLDLKGGMHLILRVETEKLSEDAKADAVSRAIEILRNRIDGLGVGEPVIQRQGKDQIIVQLPGVTDRDSALRMIGQVAQLTFHLVEDDPEKLAAALAGKVPDGYLLKTTKKKKEPLLIRAEPALKGEAIQDARADFNSSGFGEPRISLTFNGPGAKAFAKLTREHTGERLAIVLDGQVLSAPNIREPILSGRGEITGQFTYDEAALLALALRSGSLPAPMRIEEERTIGPLLGRDSVRAGITAMAVGGAVLVLFMAAYYRLAGLISDAALLLNLLLIVGSLGFLNTMLPESQVTLTLPGIAGIILTLGMAVDANVLINERMREELRNGRPLNAAINNGFNKAFKAIFDSNTTTLIAAFMLFQFGSGPIKGFAVTLTIGLLCSLFTALFVTRTFFRLLLENSRIRTLKMNQFCGETRIDFVSKRYVCLTLSAILIAVGLAHFFRQGKAAYGIDFAGGQIQEYRFSRPVSAADLRRALDARGVKDVIIQQFAQTPDTVIIRSPEDTYDRVVATFKDEMPEASFEILRIEKVGPVVGEALRRRAILAIVFALGGILIYVGFRFRHFDFAAAGVVALLHDVFITLGALSLLGRQVDLLVVTALLTIAGYSINDTIIIYDRIRENMARSRSRTPLREIINLSINQTLSRTILTTITTLIVVVTLYLRGGEVLNTFALCLIIGFIAGTYSTIFIASPLVLAWQRKR